MENFALIGAAGYIAPRHMQAIKDTGNNLFAAIDPFDSVGILDRYFPDAKFYKTFENFEKDIEKNARLDYVSICSPNAFHEAHIRFALRNKAHAICEKPLALTVAELDELAKAEQEFDRKVYTILQLRVHPALLKLKRELAMSPGKKYDVNLCYITSRGSWYDTSWKADPKVSGGLMTNIGVHFYDMLYWLFGDVEKNELHFHDGKTAAGYLELAHGKVKWALSIDRKCLPRQATDNQQTTYRSITVDGNEIEFSGGFTDLHTLVYENILSGHGFGVSEAKTAISIVENLRTLEPMGIQGYSHPIVREYQG